MAADEGQGTTLTLGTSTWDTTALIRSITFDPITRDALDSSYLGTTLYRTFIPAELADSGSFSCEFFHNGDTEPPILNIPETITITFPIQTGWSTGPLITATGFCTEYKPGDATVGELMMGSAKFKWSSSLTFTDHT